MKAISLPEKTPFVLDEQAVVRLGFFGTSGSLRRAVREGRFPRPIKVSERGRLWVRADIESWLTSRASAA